VESLHIEEKPAESPSKYPAKGESICILDMEIDLSRASSPPRPEPQEEVVFLD
jgi:hypothetical protein